MVLSAGRPASTFRASRVQTRSSVKPWGCQPPKQARYFHPVKAIPGTLQEGGASFQTTHWTLVLQAGQGEPSEARQEALSVFCESYWPPLYAFLRHRRYAPADAQDLVQAFFVHLFEKNILERADREKGRLRTFLLTSLQNFLINEIRSKESDQARRRSDNPVFRRVAARG